MTRFSSSSLPDVIAFEKEIEILKDLPSQNKFIVQYLGFQRTEEQLEVFTALYDGNLLELIEKQSEPFGSREILVIADSVLNALVTLHSRKLIHRDVKSANVFYEMIDGKMNYVLGDYPFCGEKFFHFFVHSPFVGDFGESKILLKKLATTLTGTTRWIAPEVFDRKGGKGYSFEADIWSFGMLL